MKSKNQLNFWLIVFIGLAVSCYIFYPGFLSFDSYSQFEQLSTGQYSNAHPALMTRLWALTNLVLYGPGGIFLLHQFMYWSGIALIAVRLAPRSFFSLLLGFAIGFFPPYFMISLHIWKDAAMLAGLSLFVGLYLTYKANSQKAILGMSFVFLTYALGVRHNSLFAAIPLYYLLGIEINSSFKLFNRFKWHLGTTSKEIICSVLIFVLGYLSTSIVNSYNVRKGKLFPMIYVWDLTAMSIKENKVLVPEEIILDKNDSEKVTLEKMNEVYRNNVNNTISTVVSFYPREDHKLYWVKMIFKYPRSYFEHRTEVFLELINFGREKAYYPFHPGIDTDPFKKRDFRDIRKKMPKIYYDCIRFAKWLSHTILYKAYLYIFLSFFLVLHYLFKRLRNKERSNSYKAMILSLSGLLYVLPLYFFAPASDFRYNVWLIFLVVISCLLTFRKDKI